MTAEQKWNYLRNEMALALEEGEERGYAGEVGTQEHGYYMAYKYVMDKMDELDRRN